MIGSAFGEILKKTVEATPSALGGALAAGDGETVDFWTDLDNEEWSLLTAHFGIIVSHVRHALHTFHFGDIQFIYLTYDAIDIAIQVVEHEYYVILALAPPVHLGLTRKSLASAAVSLRKEMA